MPGGVRPSRWAVQQFGEHAAEVMRHVVTGLVRGQRGARLVQATAETAGAADRRAYGSMWATRYSSVVEQFELADLPGYQAHRPKGASYSLAVVNGRVLIPFRHATSLKEPISHAKLSNTIPRRVSRDHGVQPAPTLFDDASGGVEATMDPSVADAAAAARAEKLTVVYVAYVANADSDEVLGAWWGTPESLEDDGTMVWSPEKLDLSIATVQQTFIESSGDLHTAGTAAPTPGFAEGEIPVLNVTPRPETTELPSAETEPTPSEADDGDD
jgi:hypothetical protein